MKEKFLTCGDCENTEIFESKEIEKAWAILFADKARTYSVVLLEKDVCDKKLSAVLCAMGADAVAKCVDVEEIRKEYAQFLSDSSVNGVLIKDIYKEKTGKTVRIISVEREKTQSAYEGVDVVLTKEELSLLTKEVEELGVSLADFKEREFDVLLSGKLMPILKAWLDKKSAGLIEEETEVECVELDDGAFETELPEIKTIVLDTPKKEKQEPYATRISKKDRRKMKRQNKKNA